MNQSNPTPFSRLGLVIHNLSLDSTSRFIRTAIPNASFTDTLDARNSRSNTERATLHDGVHIEKKNHYGIVLKITPSCDFPYPPPDIDVDNLYQGWRHLA